MSNKQYCLNTNKLLLPYIVFCPCETGINCPKEMET